MDTRSRTHPGQIGCSAFGNAIADHKQRHAEFRLSILVLAICSSSSGRSRSRLLWRGLGVMLAVALGLGVMMMMRLRLQLLVLLLRVRIAWRINVTPAHVEFALVLVGHGIDRGRRLVQAASQNHGDFAASSDAPAARRNLKQAVGTAQTARRHILRFHRTAGQQRADALTSSACCWLELP
jgi:hypothetical protein